MEIGTSPLELGIGVVCFVAGAGLGLVAGRWNRSARARIRALEAELAQVTHELAEYRDRVEKHFVQTSDLFADLTRQYAAVWDHLAEGARSLCPDRVAALGHGFAEGPLQLAQPPVSPGGVESDTAANPQGKSALDDRSGPREAESESAAPAQEEASPAA